MAVPLIWQVVERPVTSFLATACTAIWLWLKQKQLGYEEVGLNYQRFIHEKQFWRLVSSQFSHVDGIHLLFNMASLWSIGFWEHGGRDSILYLQQSLWLLVGTGLVCLAMYAVAVELLHQDAYKHHCIVGYSGVIFGWMALLSARGAATFSLFGILQLPMRLAPFGALVITSIIVPRASFLGHLSGIVMGYFMAYAMYPLTTNTLSSLALLAFLLAGVGWSLREQFDMPALNVPAFHQPLSSFTRFRQTQQPSDDIETGANEALLSNQHAVQPNQ